MVNCGFGRTLLGLSGPPRVMRVRVRPREAGEMVSTQVHIALFILVVVGALRGRFSSVTVV